MCMYWTDLWKRFRQNVRMPFESQCMTCYLMAIVMFTLSVTILKIFIAKCAWPWAYPIEEAKVKYKYNIWKPICDFPFIVNSQLYHICDHFKTITCEQWKIADFNVWPLNRSEDHKVQNHRLAIGFQTYSPTEIWKWQLYLKRFLRSLPIIRTLHILSALNIKDRVILSFRHKISTRVTHFECQNDKSIQWSSVRNIFQIKSQYMTTFWTAIVMFFLSVSIFIIFTADTAWARPLKWDKIKCEYPKRKPMHKFLFDDNSTF